MSASVVNVPDTITYDRQEGGFNLEWESRADFHEQAALGIEIWLSKTRHALVLSATAMATATADDGSHLPEKENIALNQHSWPETAARMGVKRGNKAKKGKVDSALTAHRRA